MSSLVIVLVEVWFYTVEPSYAKSYLYIRKTLP